VFALLPRAVLRRESRLAVVGTRRYRDPIVGLISGVLVPLVVWAALSRPLPTDPSADRQLELAGAAHGKDVVTVILADFRGLDTLVEVTVVVVALLGVAALLRRGKLWGAGPGRGGWPACCWSRSSWSRPRSWSRATPTWATGSGPGSSPPSGCCSSTWPSGGRRWSGCCRSGTPPSWPWAGALCGRVRRARHAPKLAMGGLLVALAVAFVPVLGGRAPLEHAPAPGAEGIHLGSLELLSAVAFDVGVFALVLGMVVATIHLIASTVAERGGQP